MEERESARASRRKRRGKAEENKKKLKTSFDVQSCFGEVVVDGSLCLLSFVLSFVLLR
jgi:hypothetical protein